MRNSSTLKQIGNAFPTAPVPEMSLRAAVLVDRSSRGRVSGKDIVRSRDEDDHLPWTKLSDEMLIECCGGLVHLDTEAFVYYLGAFLSFAVRNADATILSREGGLLGTTVFSITNRSNYNTGRLKGLNDMQIDCVVAVLQLLSNASDTHANDAQKALARYWLAPKARRKSVLYIP